MTRATNAIRRTCTTAGIAGVAAGCAGMAAMLPGAIAGALGAVGIGGSSALARTLSPVAQPLYITSAVLVVFGAVACSRLVAAAAITGSLLLYLSMFQLASDASNGGSMSMMAMHHDSGASHAEPMSFYTGLALIATALALSAWRRRQRHCRPILHIARPLPLGH